MARSYAEEYLSLFYKFADDIISSRKTFLERKQCFVPSFPERNKVFLKERRYIEIEGTTFKIHKLKAKLFASMAKLIY